MKTRISGLLSIFMVMIMLFVNPITVVSAATSSAGAVGLSQVEIEGLLYMREEEKLAHDVYVVMYAKWKMNNFYNISNAETNHMAAIKTLLDRYGLPDPAKGNGLGKFTNPYLQSLYNTLVARGNTSLSEALKVGGAIEEIDILDLERYKAASTHTDVINIYSNLIAASCNHLRAFVSVLRNKTGETYAPQYLKAEDYQAIINGTY